MFQAIVPATRAALPLIKAASPYIGRAAVELAKNVGITFAVSYGIDRVRAGRLHYRQEGELVTYRELTLRVLKAEGLQVLRAAKDAFIMAAPAGVFYATSKVTRTANPSLSHRMHQTGRAVLLTQVVVSAVAGAVIVILSKEVKDVEREVKDMLDSGEPGTGYVAQDHDQVRVELFPAVEVPAETHELWDQAAAEDTEIILAEIDIAKFIRHPGKSGATYAEQLVNKGHSDPVGFAIIRAALKSSLEEHSVPENKITQVLAGFDRVAGQAA
jgi:hypothetical protein